MGSIWKLVGEKVIFDEYRHPNKTELPFLLLPQQLMKERDGW